MTWPVEHLEGPVRWLHRRDPPPDRRRVRVLVPTRPALVLGSTQPPDDVDHDAVAAAGLDVVRRASGGGAVLVTPSDPLWVDVDVPASDPLWEPDVGRAFHWLGRAWQEALAARGLAAVVHEAGLDRGRWGRRICFGSIGPGEVLVDGRKCVGIAQRRTRAGVRFQCAVLRRWRADELIDLLAWPAGERDRARAGLADAVHAVDGADALLDALVEALPG